jgi:hypothetical protein
MVGVVLFANLTTAFLVFNQFKIFSFGKAILFSNAGIFSVNFFPQSCKPVAFNTIVGGDEPICVTLGAWAIADIHCATFNPRGNCEIHISLRPFASFEPSTTSNSNAFNALASIGVSQTIVPSLAGKTVEMDCAHYFCFGARDRLHFVR